MICFPRVRALSPLRAGPRPDAIRQHIRHRPRVVQPEELYAAAVMRLHSRTDAPAVQHTIESALEPMRRDFLVPPSGKSAPSLLS